MSRTYQPKPPESLAPVEDAAKQNASPLALEDSQLRIRRKKITDKSLMKKIIVSQYAIHYNDTFRFYVAETKKNGSKLIIVDHWWNSDKVQSIRKDFLKDYFNVNKNWHNEWANYLNSIKI